MEINEQGSTSVWRASEIDKATRCMRQLGYSRLGYVPEPDAPPATVKPSYSWNLIGGLAIDDALSAFSKAQMTGDTTLTGDALIDFFKSRIGANTDTFSAQGDITGEDSPSAIEEDGVPILRLYERDMAPVIHPVAVQAEASVQVVKSGCRPTLGARDEDCLTMVGHIDLIRQAGESRVISDWKFTKKTANQMPASTYARGWAYDLMAGDGSGQTELILLRRGLKTPKIETTSHFVTKAQHTQVIRQVLTVAEMYRQRYFPLADPTSWVCSPKFCGFWAVCRGHPTGPRPIPGELTF